MMRRHRHTPNQKLRLNLGSARLEAKRLKKRLAAMKVQRDNFKGQRDDVAGEARRLRSIVRMLAPKMRVVQGRIFIPKPKRIRIKLPCA